MCARGTRFLSPGREDSMLIDKNVSRILEIIDSKRPVVHCITNYVTAGDTANMLLAIGASPVMADEPLESAQVTAVADALLINLGTISENKVKAMIESGIKANEKGIPVILDPVAVGTTDFRRNAVKEILSKVKITGVRGNVAEISFLAGLVDKSESAIDAKESNVNPAEVAMRAAKRLGCVCAVTGVKDYISDGEQVIELINGCKLLRKVTGAGCMTTAICAAMATVVSPMQAMVLGVAFMGICGQISEDNAAGGLGKFRIGLFDAAGSMSGEYFTDEIKAKQIV